MRKAYALGLYEKAMPDCSWPEKLQTAKDAGYDFVEMSIDATEKKISRVYSSQEVRRSLAALCRDMEMPVGTLNDSALTKYSLGNPDPQMRARGLEIAEESIYLAADLGARLVMIPGYDVYYEPHTEETEAMFAENVRHLALAAAAAGVQLGFETMENEFMNTVEKGMRYVSAVQSNYLQMYPDIGNMTNAAVMYGTDPVEDLRLGRGHLAALHLKETAPGRFRELPYGTGHVNFEAAIDAAWELGVRRFVTEFWHKEGGETPAYVRSWFSRIFDKYTAEA